MINPDKIEIEQRLKAFVDKEIAAGRESYRHHGMLLHFLRRFESTLPKTGWRPISEADKEVPACLLWCADVGIDKKPRGVVMGRVMVFENGDRRAYGAGMNGDWTFTAFMPLPSPPTESAGLISGEAEHRLSGEPMGNASADHAAGSRSSDGSATPSHSPANQGEGEVLTADDIDPFGARPTPQPAEAEARAFRDLILGEVRAIHKAYDMYGYSSQRVEETTDRIVTAALQGKAEAERENDALARDRNDLTEALLLSEAQLAERTRENEANIAFAAKQVARLTEMAESQIALQAERDKLVEAATRLLTHRVGDLPVKGWLRDNDASRADLAALAAALSASTTVEQAVAGDKYLIWSNEHRAWWAPDRCGYTRHHERAGRYDREEALNIAGIRGGGWPTDGNPHEIAIPERDAVAQAAIRQRGGQ